MVDLQQGRRYVPVHPDTVYSKKWSICNDQGPGGGQDSDTVYSKKWSICNRSPEEAAGIMIQFTRKNGRSATEEIASRHLRGIQFTRKNGRSATA